MNTESTPLPIRYRLRRPYAAQLDILARELAAGGQLSEDQVLQRCNRVIARAPVSAHYGSVTTLDASPEVLAARVSGLWANELQEANFAKSYVMFTRAGGQIFEFSRDLTQMFLRSDVDEVPAACLQLPYERFFIHFTEAIELRDPRAEANVAPLLTMDGAYIERVAPDVVAITPSTPRLAAGHEIAWKRENEDAAFGNFLLKLGQGTLASAVADATSTYVADSHSRKDQVLSSMINATENRSICDENIELMDRALGERFEKLANAAGLRPVIHQLVNVAANALCYITAYRDSGHSMWAQGTPKEVVGALDRATSPKRRDQIERELTWAGYRRVTLFALEGEGKSTPSNGKHASPLAHWRRGHWRMQAHGEGRTLRRLQWIRPCLINPLASKVVQGRVYVADPGLEPRF